MRPRSLVGAVLSVLRSFGERCSDLSEEYIPDPYVIAIVLTFVPGVAGLLTGTGLAKIIVEFFGAYATAETSPVIGVLVAGVVNVFIPSGGGQWVAMGPIMLDITTAFGYASEQAIVIEMLGYQLTNMIQPFWAIPLLAIANLRARDIIGYTTVAMLAGLLVVCTWLTAFFVVL